MPTFANATYKPKPGTTAARAVELLRFLPRGSALRSSDLCRRIGVHPNCGIASHLITSVRYGLVRLHKTPKAGSLRHDVRWMSGDGVPPPAAAVRQAAKRAKPVAARTAVRSVFDLAQAFA